MALCDWNGTRKPLDCLCGITGVCCYTGSNCVLCWPLGLAGLTLMLNAGIILRDPKQRKLHVAQYVHKMQCFLNAITVWPLSPGENTERCMNGWNAGVVTAPVGMVLNSMQSCRPRLCLMVAAEAVRASGAPMIGQKRCHDGSGLGNGHGK